MCRLCSYPSETTVHLLNDCPGTYPTRASLGISFDTLANESPDNIIRIARFDAWLRRILPIQQSMTDHGILAILSETLRKRKALNDTSNALCPLRKRTKGTQQRYLVIPQPNIYQATSTNKRRSETTDRPQLKRPVKNKRVF
jgi:hypothetical protein